MEQILNLNNNFLVKDDFLYKPLLLDSDYKKEVLNGPRFESLKNLKSCKSENIVESNEEHYVKFLSLPNLIQNYDKLNSKDYNKKKKKILSKLKISPEDKIKLDPKIKDIIFEVMPYFIKKRGGLKSKSLDRRDILSLINSKENISKDYVNKAKKLYELDELESKINSIKSDNLKLTQPTDINNKSELKNWFYENLSKKILKEEISELEKVFNNRKIAMKNLDIVATLLYLNELGGLDIDGFGFKKTSNKLLVYKHTGEYALKDFDGKIYLFPDCKVSVKIVKSKVHSPYVYGYYKHPFISKARSNPNICIGKASVDSSYSPRNVRKAINTGIMTLKQGYFNKSNFDGYYFLDGRKNHGEYDTTFNKISENHAKLKSGKVDITNDFLIDEDKEVVK